MLVYLQCFSILVLRWNGKWLASIAGIKTTAVKTFVSYESRLISDEFIVNAKPHRKKEKDCTIDS